MKGGIWIILLAGACLWFAPVGYAITQAYDSPACMADSELPVITVLGETSVSVDCGASYTDAGATAADACDGDLTGNIVVVNPVNTLVPRTYIVRYSVSDSSGNAAATGTRTVTVLDNCSQVTVPSLIGMTEAQARETLSGAGLVLGAIAQESSATVPAGQVLGQYPAAGTSALAGAEISVVLSTGARPARPEWFVAQGGLTWITLRWSANTEDTLSGYRLYRRADNEAEFALLVNIAATETSYRDTTVEQGVLYHYQLAAYAGMEESDYAGPVSAKTGVVSLYFDDVDLPLGGCSLIGLNITDLSGAAMTGFEIVFAFDPAVVDAAKLTVEKTAITRDLTITPTIDPQGSYTITASSPGLFSLAGLGRLFNVKVCARNDALSGGCGALTLTAADFAFTDVSDVETDLSGTGLVCVDGICGGPGDLNIDAFVTQPDAGIVLDIAVRNILAAPCHWKSGELNGDGLINCADAVIVMRMAAESSIVPGEGDQTLADARSDAPGGLMVEVGVPYEQFGEPGALVEVPVFIGNGNGLAGLDMTVTYAPATAGLTLESYSLGAQATNFAERTLVGSRYLRLGMASDTALTATKSDEGAEMVLLRFRIAESVAPGKQFPINLGGVKLAGEFGEDFDWYADVALLGGSIIVTAPPAMTMEEIAEFLLGQFNATDVNGDGKLSFDEALAVLPGMTREQFDTLDTNGNGYVSRRELEKYLNGGCGCCRRGDSAKDNFHRYIGDWLLVGLMLLVLLSVTGKTRFS